MSKTETVYIVFKTHFDIGFTALSAEVIDRYGRKMLPDVIETCAGTETMGEGRRFVWTMSAWPLVQSLRNAAPEVAARARALIRSGQIAWHALPYTTHTEFCGLEEFIRGMSSSRRLSAEFGRWPLSAKMTDVPGHTWVLPSILAAAGVKFLHLGCNACCMPPDVPRLFFWEGPDGARVLTFYSKGNYGSPLIPPEDWPFPVWLALMQTGDNMGPQGPEDIEPLLDTVRDRLPGTKAVVGTMDDFYTALSQYALDCVPVVRGDLADTWIHGVGTYPAEVAKLRALRPALTEAEKAFCLADMLGIVNSNDKRRYAEALDEAYGLGLLFGEHTWGMDVKSTLHRRYYDKKAFLEHKADDDVLRIEHSWQEQRDRALGAERAVAEVMPCVMNVLANNISAEGDRFAVFNGLGWRRDAWVRLPALGANCGSVVDTRSGMSLPVVETRDGRAARVPGLPAFGYCTLVPGPSRVELPRTGVVADAATGVLENRWFRIAADRRGGALSSLVEKETGREWAGRRGLGRYRYDVYGIDDVTEFIRSYCYRFSDWVVKDLGRIDYPDIPHRTFWAKNFDITAERDGRSASLILSARLSGESVLEYGNATKLTIRVTLYDDEPYIDLEYTLHDKQETPYIEAGHAVFALNLKNHSVRINKPGSVVDPMADIVRDANNGLYCCENWVDVSDGERGMAFVPFHTPLFSLGGQAIYLYEPKPRPKPPELLFNLFNNSWGTNFPQWMGGDHTFRYRLIPHAGGWQEGGVQQAAMEAVTPALCGFARGAAGALPPSGDFLALPRGVTAMALKPAYDGSGYALRLRNLGPDAADGSMELGLPFDAEECDLLERKAPQAGNAVLPFGLRTVMLSKIDKE